MHIDIKVHIKRNKMTINDFARKLGYTPTYLSKVINKKIKPSLVLATMIEEETQGKVKAETLMKG